MKYKYGQFHLTSNLNLSSLLAQAPQDLPLLCQVHMRSETFTDEANVEWYLEFTTEQNQAHLGFGIWNNQYVVSVFNIIFYIITPQNHIIECFSNEKISDDMIVHYLINQVLPRYLSFRGMNVIHAAAVAIDGAGVLFIGDSGHGKSTLAQSFNAENIPILNDDAIILSSIDDTPFVQAPYPNIRIRSDSANALATTELSAIQTKRQIKPQSAISGSLPCQVAFVIDNPQNADDTIRIRPMNASNAFMSLVQASFRFDIKNKVRLAEEFKFFTFLTKHLRFYHLQYPRQFERLPELRQAITETVLRDLSITEM